jgi:hypothetical protein
MLKVNCDVKQATKFFQGLDNGCSLPSEVKFRGVTLKNRPPVEMICDCCGSGDDCCGYTPTDCNPLDCSPLD